MDEFSGVAVESALVVGDMLLMLVLVLIEAAVGILVRMLFVMPPPLPSLLLLGQIEQAVALVDVFAVDLVQVTRDLLLLLRDVLGAVFPELHLPVPDDLRLEILAPFHVDLSEPLELAFALVLDFIDRVQLLLKTVEAVEDAQFLQARVDLGLQRKLTLDSLPDYALIDALLDAALNRFPALDIAGRRRHVSRDGVDFGRVRQAPAFVFLELVQGHIRPIDSRAQLERGALQLLSPFKKFLE